MTEPQSASGRLLSGRYRLEGVLGRGGMGTVWRAEDEMLGRIVAVKELRLPEGVDDDEKHRLIVRTLREAKATARIRHRAAVTVFDVVEEDDRPWIVMELVESRSLAEVIKEDGPLKPARAAEIALDVLGVLSAAHAHGILHRDVKPSNVLIGDEGRVVLTDFGIASIEGDMSITSTGMLVGAPSYISPERARGQKPGPPADLWSLGGTLYAMVEGKPPYDRGSALATLTAVMTEDLATPANAGPLRPVIEGLLTKDPAKRLDAPATRSMLKRIVAEDIARAEATTQLKVPTAPPVKEEPKPKPKNDGRVGTVRVGSKAAGAVPPQPKPAPAPTVTPTPAPAPKQPVPMQDRLPKRPVLIAGVALLVLVLIAVGAVLLRPSSHATKAGNTASAEVAHTAAGTPAGTPADSPAASSSADSPSAAGSPASSAPSQPSSPSTYGAPSPSATAQNAVVPAGYTVMRDPSGFSIAVPNWMKDAGIDGVQHKYKGNGSTLIVEYTKSPHASALADWEDSDKAGPGTFNNYQSIKVAQAPFRGWTNSADWEWKYTGKDTGTLLHSLNRGFVVENGKYGYAIYWIVPDADWNSSAIKDAIQVAFNTFQPAP